MSHFVTKSTTARSGKVGPYLKCGHKIHAVMNYTTVELGSGLRPNAINNHLITSGGGMHTEGCALPKRVPGIATWEAVSRRLVRELMRFPLVYAAYFTLGPFVIYKVCKSMLMWTRCYNAAKEGRYLNEYREAHLELLDTNLDPIGITGLIGGTEEANGDVGEAFIVRVEDGTGYGLVGEHNVRPRRLGKLTAQILMIVREKHGVLANTESNRMIVRRTILMQENIIRLIRPTHMVQWLPMMVTLAMIPTKHEVRCAQLLNPPDTIWQRITRYVYGDELQDRVQEMNRLRNV